MKRLFPIFFLLIISLTTCIDPFYLELDDYESLLVVEGMITDEHASYTIKLSKTFLNVDASADSVAHAEVHVLDENGVITVFHELEPGIYKSDSALFTGRVGGTYTLHIKTEDGLEYISDSCSMTAVPDIGSLYYELDSELFDNGQVEEEGLRIYLDAGQPDEECQYLRWDFEEVWKFRVPYPIFYQDLGFKQYKTTHVENDICWRYEHSKQIFIHSLEEQSSGLLSRKPIHFIASGLSNRLLKQYSIQVNQYSLSKEEFLFWEQLREITENGGDLFEKQPFPIEGNIRCINSGDENVLGYFQVSAVKNQRMYITKSQVNELDIPAYEHPCDRIVWHSWRFRENIYKDLLSRGYVLFWVEEDDFGGAISYQFTSSECADCSLTGDLERPDFWVDMD